MKETFHIGDIVRCINDINHSCLRKNEKYTVTYVGINGLDVVQGKDKYYGYYDRFEVVEHTPINNRDYKSIKVGDRILFLGDKGMSYIEMTVKEIADEGKAIKNQNGFWYRVSPQSGDSMNFKEILPAN